MKRTAPAFILAAGSLWGTMGIFVRRLEAYHFTSLQVASLRIIGGGVIFLLIASVMDWKLLKIRPRDILWFLGTGIASILLFTVCYFRTISMASLSVAAILLYTAPIMVMLMSLVLFHEKLTKKKAAALLMAFAGCILVTGTGGGGHTPAAAVVFGLISAFGYGLYSILGTFVLRRYPPVTVTTFSFLCGGIGALAFCNPADICRKIQRADHPGEILILILLTAIVTAVLPYLFYTIGLSSVRASSASIMASVEPVVATFAGCIVFGEALTPLSLAGVALVVGAIVLLNIPSKDHGDP